MAIFIISRRPMHPHNERTWSYINRFSADNAEVSAMPRREAAYAALRLRAESMAQAWRVAEPDSQFRVMDSGVNNISDKFDPEFDKVVEAPAVEADDEMFVVAGSLVIAADYISRFKRQGYSHEIVPHDGGSTRLRFFRARAVS